MKRHYCWSVIGVQGNLLHPTYSGIAGLYRKFDMIEEAEKSLAEYCAQVKQTDSGSQFVLLTVYDTAEMKCP